jgi:hypothetical protein
MPPSDDHRKYWSTWIVGVRIAIAVSLLIGVRHDMRCDLRVSVVRDRRRLTGRIAFPHDKSRGLVSRCRGLRGHGLGILLRRKDAR